MNYLRALAAVVSFGAPLVAQETAQLSGFVWDSSGALVPAAAVTVVNEETGFRRAVHSAEAGFYQAPYLNPGHYKVTIRKEGFRTLVQFGVKLEAAQSARLDFHLQLGDAQEVITVASGPVFINAQDASVSTFVGRNWIEQLPLNGRGLLTLMELAPGAVITPANAGEAGQFTVNGQRPNTNYFTVDGVSANTGVSGGLPAQMPGGSLPNMTAFGSLHSLASVEALDEFRMQTSTATPEYARSSGAQVEVSSRSGSNDFHGVVFDAARNEALDANDWFANRQGVARLPLRFQDFGATLGGPIRRNRTFFFGSYEGLRLRQPFAWQTTVPSTAARQNALPAIQQLLNAFPLPNGPDLGGGIASYTAASSRPSDFDAASLRIDHALTAGLLLFGRYTRTPSSTESGYPQVNSVEIQSHSITVGLNGALTPDVTEQFRFNMTGVEASSRWRNGDGQPFANCYTDAALFSGSAPCNSFYRFAINGVGQFVAGADTLNRQRQWNVVEMIQLRRGAHDLRFGVDYRRLIPAREGPFTSVSVTAASMQDVLNGNVSVGVAQSLQKTTLVQRTSLFAEDTWLLTPRLTATYGLAWNIDPSPMVPQPPSTIGPPAAPGAAATTISIWQTSYTEIAPHAGLAFRVTADGRTVLRAGAGRYYAPDFAVAMDGINGAPYNVWQFNPGTFGGASPAVPSLVTYGFARDLHVPSSWQWNVTVEHGLTANDAVSLGYVGSVGHDLLRRELGSRSSLLSQSVLATNHGQSAYHSLQAQYRRRLTRGVQGLVSYTWSHSLDNGSADSAIYFAPSDAAAARDYASSDFDVRHSFTAAFSMELPAFRGWALDGLFRTRSGFPVNVLDAESALGLTFANVFRPGIVAGVPVWISDPAAPGGRRLNPSAFVAQTFVQGNLGRNAIRGLGMSQIDLAVHCTFAIGEKRSLQLRAEAFNLENRANFGDPVRFLASPLFGRSASMLSLMLGGGSPSNGLTPAFQPGGPRSVQLVARFIF